MTKESELINGLRNLLDNYDEPVSANPTLALIGDSRLNGDWNAILDRNDIINLSVAGTKSSDWLANWQSNINLIPSSVTKAIVQFGKNEIDAAWSTYNNAHGIQDVVCIIQNHRPSIKVGVLATLPVAAFASGASAINTAVQNLLPTLISQVSAAPAVYYEGYQGIVTNAALNPYYADSGGAHLNTDGKAAYAAKITELEALLN